MPAKKTKRNMSRAKQERLAGIERLLWWRGWVRRGDLMQMFGVSRIQASLDLRLYRQRYPEALRYDASTARYVATSHLRLKTGTGEMEEALDVFAQTPRPATQGRWFAGVTLPARRVEKAIAQAVVRAVLGGLALHIRYASMHSNTFRWRWITPHAFGHDGFRWHVRAYCHDEREFRDFVLGRIAETGETSAAGVTAAEDVDWVRPSERQVMVDPQLGPAQRRALELDFLLKAGRLTINAPPALMIYALAALGLSEEGGSMPVRFRPC
jgi:hypothetical protein